MLIKKEIMINADITTVWQIFSRLERWPKWGGYIINAGWNTKKKWKQGSKFTQIVKGFNVIKSLKSEPMIIKIKPYSIVTWRGARKLIKGIHTFKFQKVGSRTKVTNEEYFKGLLAPILFPLIKNNFEIYFQKFLDGLKKEAEK